MKTYFYRMISLVLAAVMLFSAAPVTAFADDGFSGKEPDGKGFVQVTGDEAGAEYAGKTYEPGESDGADSEIAGQDRTPEDGNAEGEEAIGGARAEDPGKDEPTSEEQTPEDGEEGDGKIVDEPTSVEPGKDEPTSGEPGDNGDDEQTSGEPEDNNPAAGEPGGNDPETGDPTPEEQTPEDDEEGDGKIIGEPTSVEPGKDDPTSDNPGDNDPASDGPTAEELLKAEDSDNPIMGKTAKKEPASKESALIPVGGEYDPIFKSFAIRLDTSNPYTEKLADGTYRKRTDSQDRIYIDYELNEGKEAEANKCKVVFSSERGTMTFGYAGAGADPVYEMDFADWRADPGCIKVVRCGCGYDTVYVTIVTKGEEKAFVEEAWMDILQEGWESFMGSSYSHRRYSGKYFKDGGFLTGWQKLKYDETAGYYFPNAAGTVEAYFDPVTRKPVKEIFEIEGKKYCFRPADLPPEGEYAPYVLRKAEGLSEIVNLGSEEFPAYIYLDGDGSLITGLVEAASDLFYFDPATGLAAMYTWVRDGDDIYFADMDCKLTGDGKITYGGADYILMDKRLMKGLIKDKDGHKYYCDPVSGAVTYGFITIKKKKYLQTEDGIPQEAGIHHCTAIDDSFYTNSQGIVEGGKEVTLKVSGEDRIFYINPDGTMFTGYRKTGKKTYHYTEQGREEVEEELITDPETDETIGYGYLNDKGELIFYTDKLKSEIVKDRIAVLRSVPGVPVRIINNKGMISHGWYTMGGKKYYTDKVTGNIERSVYRDELRMIEGKLWYISKEGFVTCPESSYERWVDYEDDKYYIGGDGRPVTGWKTIDEKVYYFEKSGALNKTGLIGNKYYPVQSGGYITKPGKAGVYNIWGQGYYLNADGSVKTGWVSAKEGGVKKRYYTSPGDPRNGFIDNDQRIYRIGGKFYCFENDGSMRTGWQKGFTEYSDAATGETLKNCPSVSSWYYFDKATGAMVKGKKNIKDEHPVTHKKGTFYFGTDLAGKDPMGVMISGKIVKSGSRLVTVDDGQEIDVSDLPNGPREMFEDTVCFISKGKLAAGFRTYNDNKYYFDPATGAMVRNTLKRISGKWYYFDHDGVFSPSGNGYIIASDGSTTEVILRTDSKGCVTGIAEGDTRRSDVRVRIAGSTYIINDKGKFAKGPYTIKSGPDKGMTFLAGSDYTIAEKEENMLIRYGKKHYVTDGEGRILKNGCYQVGYGYLNAFTDAERAQIDLTSLAAWADGNTFYTDSTGAVIKNKVVTSPSGNRVRLGKYGIAAGPFSKYGGKWYCYDGYGAMAPGKYRMKVKVMATGKTENAYITIGKDGRITDGIRRTDGSVIKGYVDIKDGLIAYGKYYLDKKGLPAAGTKVTTDGKITFDKTSGRPLTRY
ncbi:MAG: hypothetical protein K6F53_10025 [Lachnospiraceae bacterium]|nr:hypothetical protein [Lachnospiraceae bacterium]